MFLRSSGTASMSNRNSLNPLPGIPELSEDLRRLTIMWGACCISPVLYLAATWFIKTYFMNGAGFFPLNRDVWSRALIGLIVLIVCIQGSHLLIKSRYRSRLANVISAPDNFIQVLTRRTLLLIFLSEMAVFTGFCLFLLQGDPAPVFGSGIVSMLLYAQSHPRSSLPFSKTET